MTPAERQALREKHAPQDGDPTNPCEFCWPTAYPCDVIKVLDEVDRVMNAAEVYGLMVEAWAGLNSDGTITELAKSDQNRNLNSTIPAQTDPYGPQPDQAVSYTHLTLPTNREV